MPMAKAIWIAPAESQLRATRWRSCSFGTWRSTHGHFGALLNLPLIDLDSDRSILLRVCAALNMSAFSSAKDCLVPSAGQSLYAANLLTSSSSSSRYRGLEQWANSSEIWDASDTLSEALHYACSSDSQARAFLEEDADASVVCSSCHFSLSDVGPTPPPKDLEGSWEAIGNLFGHQLEHANSSPHHRATLVPEAVSREGSTRVESSNETAYWVEDEHYHRGLQYGSWTSTREHAEFEQLNKQAQQSRAAASQPMQSRVTTDDRAELNVLHHLGSSMLKLDVRTRLCIRNALYRLAKGATSRNGSFNTETNTASRLETCTNSMDRTVAGLLFYRQAQGSEDDSPNSPSSWVSHPQAR